MNPVWLVRNLATSWRHRLSLRDFVVRLRWIYGTKPREWTIGFRFRPPIGDIRLLLRANRGADAFILSEVFEHQCYRLPLAVAPATILDLGANIGLSAVYFARFYPDAELACVEPVSANLRLLRRNLELNAVCGTVVGAAIDECDGTAVMALDSRDYGHRVVTAAEPAAGAQENVTAVSVPTLCRQLGWNRIGLLKVDIEGHEKILFRGACDWLASVDAMCVECHDDFGMAELVALAKRYGFEHPRQLSGIWFMARRGTVWA